MRAVMGMRVSPGASSVQSTLSLFRLCNPNHSLTFSLYLPPPPHSPIKVSVSYSLVQVCLGSRGSSPAH